MEKCEVVQDLIPLYCDEVASEGSRVLVEEHIKTCDVCQEILKKMNDTNEMPGMGIENIEISALKAVKKKIRIKIAAVTFTAVGCILFFLWAVLYWSMPMPYNASNIDVSARTFRLRIDGEITEPDYYAVTIDVRNNYRFAHFMQIDDVLYFHVSGTVYTRLFGGRFNGWTRGVNTGFWTSIHPSDLGNGMHRYKIRLNIRSTTINNMDGTFEVHEPTSINRIYYLQGNFIRLWSNEAAFERAMRNAVLLWERQL